MENWSVGNEDCYKIPWDMDANEALPETAICPPVCKDIMTPRLSFLNLLDLRFPISECLDCPEDPHIPPCPLPRWLPVNEDPANLPAKHDHPTRIPLNLLNKMPRNLPSRLRTNLQTKSQTIVPTELPAKVPGKEV